MMNPTLGELLELREAELGLLEREAAERCGMKPSQYWEYRNNARIPTGPVRKRLAEGLGIAPVDLARAIGATAVKRQRPSVPSAEPRRAAEG